MTNNIVAVLSTTVLPLDGLYLVHKIDIKTIEEKIKGVPHYIGHPSTKEIVEKLGAVAAPSKLFEGLHKGESAVTFAIKQGMSSRATEGRTVDQDVDPTMLECRIVTRMEDIPEDLISGI